MPIKYYNQPPYYDDFDQTKNYLRVLFRPGYAVQARELTQLQTAIQAQIDRFGSYVFKDGKRVIGAESVLDKKYAYVKLESVFQYPATSGGTIYYPEGTTGHTAYYTTAVGKVVTGMDSGITATVLEAVHSTTDDSLTIYVNYTSAGTDNVSHFFTAGEFLSYTDESGTRYFKVAASDAVGYGTRFSITEGVFFTKGNFVYTPAEAIIVSKYTTNPSAKIVYSVTESIVGTGTDTTLADNSLGTPNSSAPGADRYQIALTLTTQPYADSDRTEENIIQLMTVRGGLITGSMGDELNEINKVLAQRTYEESGNYTVNPFRLNVREYLNDGTNGGAYTAAQIASMQGFTGPSAIATATTYGEQRLAAALEPGIAYVNGFRIQTLDTTYVGLLKARDSVKINTASIVTPLGGYVYINSLSGMPDIDTYHTINLRSATSTPTTIGTARARGIEKYSGSTYKLYLFDVTMDSGHAFSEVGSVQDTSQSPAFSASIVIDPVVGYAQIQDTPNSSLVYKLPADAISTLLNGDESDVIYYARRAFSGSTGGGTSITLNAANELFYTATASDYVVINGTTGAVASPSVALGGGGTSVTLSGLSSSTTYYVTAPVQRTGETYRKSKTLQASATKSISSPNTTVGGSDSLGKCDILKIRNVYMSPDFNTAATSSHTDIASRYELDNGQRENFYDVGRIVLKTGSSKPTGQLLVVFDYFTHGAGDYFTVDSYTDIAYEDIPAFNSSKGKIELRDAVDFRPRKSDAGTDFTSTGASTTHAVVPSSLFITDIYHYLARADKVYVNKNGQFAVQYGLSAANPVLPADPADSMILYTLQLNPYTFGPKDLSSTFVDNRRYTMRDIGRLEKRISNVEYYTSLSLLEKETANKQIFDSGMQRYKNGFVVDPFINHSIGAVDHPDYSCSVDLQNGNCRPRFYQDNAALIYNSSSSSNLRKTGDLITLDYSEVPMIQQTYASDAEYVNPHAAFGWKGTLELSPPGDDWIETTYLPDLITNVSTSTYVNSSWNSWNYAVVNNFGTWYGTFSQNDQKSAIDYAKLLSDSFSSTFNYTFSVVKQNTQSSSGITSSNSQTASAVDNVVSNSTVQYIRSRKIYFRASGLKPNSKVYAFFDGISVADYVRPENAFVSYASAADNTLYTNATSHPDGSGILVSSANGTVVGSFVIPYNSTLKFLTGDRTFRLIDNTLNDVTNAYTYAEATYVAKGSIQTHQRTIVSVAQPTIVPSAAPVSNPYQAPTKPTVSVAVQGRAPRYINIPFNLTANASSSSAAGVITKLEIFGRSGNPDATAGTWVSLGSITPNSYTATHIVTDSSTNQPGQYQYKAVVTVGSNTYESNYIIYQFAALPAELVGVPNDGSSTFYY